jgi:hypothetical protein
MKKYGFITLIGFLFIIPHFQGCDEPDPACEGAKRVKIDLETLAAEEGDIMDNLRFHMEADVWCFYHDFSSDPACGHSALDLVYSIRYSAVLEDKTVVFNPYLVVNNKRVKESGFIGASFDGNSVIMKGGTYQIFSEATPYIFNIRCGIELKTILLLTPEQAKRIVRTYLRSIDVKLEYLKL